MNNINHFNNPSSNNNVISGVYYCNNDKLNTMNKEIYDRNIPSKPLQMSFDPRQVQTRYVKFPMIDCKPVSHVPIQYRGQYNQHDQFNPGTCAPYQGFASHIDQDSRLKDIFMPTQKYTGQTKYIPSSSSELYKTPVIKTSKPVNMTHTDLFTRPRFAPFNPNTCNLGGHVLYNHTRQQVKDLSLNDK